MRSPRARHHVSGRRESFTRKYDDDDGYSPYESDRRTPFSEYESISRTNGKRTVYSEYTTDADYTDGDRSSYSESDNGKRTPYSEYVTEYSDETDDDRMSGTLGIARNQYCTTLNGLVEGSESSSSESSYSQSTFASDFDRMCNANVNTNCMATLFNRNTDVPGTIHCGNGEHSDSHQKMSLPIPLHYMDHLVPSKQELNSALDNFAQKFDTGDEERPGFPQVYKSLFEANLSQTASNEDEERVVDYAPRRKVSDRNRSQEVGLAKAKREVSSKVEKVKEPDILSPPSHIIIKDDFTAVSSAESFGFAPETQKPALGGKYKSERREGNKRHASPRHSSPRHVVVPHRPSPRHTTSHRPSPRHSSPERPSPRHSSPRHTTEKSKSENVDGKPDAPVATRHGLDRLMRKQATSPSKRHVSDEEESPAFKGNAGLKSPLSGDRGVSRKGKSGVGKTADASKPRQSTAPREETTSRTNSASQLRGSKSHRLPDRRDPDAIIGEESPSLDERLVPAMQSIAKVSSSRLGKQFMVNSKALRPSQKKPSLMKNEYDDMVGAEDTNEPVWRNPANSIPHVLSLKPTQTAVSELTGEGGGFGENKRGSAPFESTVESERGNAAVNVHVLSLKQTQTAVSELTGEAGDFGEARGLSVPLVVNPRGEESTSRMAGDFERPSHVEKKDPVRSRFESSEGENIMQVQTPSTRNRDLANGLRAPKPNKATQNEPISAEAEPNDYTVSMRSAPNKKAETLDRLEDALMGSRKSFFSDQKSRREGLDKTQAFTIEESPVDARLATGDPGAGRSNGNVEGHPQQTTAIESQVEQIKNKTKNVKSKPTQQELDNAIRHRQVEPFETKNIILQRTEEMKVEEAEGRGTDTRHSKVDVITGDTTKRALSPYPESFSDYYQDLSSRKKDQVSGDRSDVRAEKEMQELEGDDPTSLSALDNEISLLESQITGLEQHDQIPDTHLNQASMASENNFKDQATKSDEALMLTVEATHKSIQPQLPIGPSKSPSVLSESGRKTSGDYHQFKPPLVPIQHDDQISKQGRKQNSSSNSKVHSMQNKSTDATLVTAPTVMTMDTPFTMDAPLVLSPTTAKGPEERKWDRNSNMLVATAIALPSETGSSDRPDIDAPFFFVFIVGTKRYFADVVFIIVAWVRHLSSMGFIQRQQGRVQVGLMVPPIADSDVLYELQLQRKSLGISQFASPTSEEPGTVVESFVPEMWEENSGGKPESFFHPVANSSIWNRLSNNKKKEIQNIFGAQKAK